MIFALTPRRIRLLAALWTLGIVVAVTIPASSVPDTPPDIGFDKIVHLIMFAGFGALWMEALNTAPRSGEGWSMRQRLLLVGCIGLILAAGTEWVQHAFLSSRDGDLYDVAANTIGLGAGIGWAVWRARVQARSAAS